MTAAQQWIFPPQLWRGEPEFSAIFVWLWAAPGSSCCPCRLEDQPAIQPATASYSQLYSQQQPAIYPATGRPLVLVQQTYCTVSVRFTQPHVAVSKILKFHRTENMGSVYIYLNWFTVCLFTSRFKTDLFILYPIWLQKKTLQDKLIFFCMKKSVEIQQCFGTICYTNTSFIFSFY